MAGTNTQTLAVTLQLVTNCKSCEAVLSGRSTSCPACGSKYHPSCALLLGTALNGGFNRCCSRRPPSPSPFSMEAFKNLIVEEIRVEIKDVVTKTIEETLGESIRSTLQSHMSSFTATIDSTINSTLTGIETNLNNSLAAIRSTIDSSNTAVNERFSTV